LFFSSVLSFFVQIYTLRACRDGILAIDCSKYEKSYEESAVSEETTRYMPVIVTALVVGALLAVCYHRGKSSSSSSKLLNVGDEEGDIEMMASGGSSFKSVTISNSAPGGAVQVITKVLLEMELPESVSKRYSKLLREAGIRTKDDLRNLTRNGWAEVGLPISLKEAVIEELAGGGGNYIPSSSSQDNNPNDIMSSILACDSSGSSSGSTLSSSGRHGAGGGGLLGIKSLPGTPVEKSLGTQISNARKTSSLRTKNTINTSSGRGGSDFSLESLIENDAVPSSGGTRVVKSKPPRSKKQRKKSTKKKPAKQRLAVSEITTVNNKNGIDEWPDLSLDEPKGAMMDGKDDKNQDDWDMDAAELEEIDKMVEAL